MTHTLEIFDSRNTSTEYTIETKDWQTAKEYAALRSKSNKHKVVVYNGCDIRWNRSPIWAEYENGEKVAWSMGEELGLT